MRDFSIRRHTRILSVALLMLASAGAFGCGDDDDTEGDDDGGAGSSGKSGGSSGTGGTDGGTSGTGSGGSMAGTGGMRAPVVCGGMMCSVPGGSRLQACCVEDECGLGLQTVCQLPDMPGELDTTCPDHVTQAMQTLKGCCKPNNQCGVMSVSGLGCVERTELASYAGGPLDELECGTEADAGEADGGP
jgi:hypothetical protein